MISLHIKKLGSFQNVYVKIGNIEKAVEGNVDIIQREKYIYLCWTPYRNKEIKSEPKKDKTNDEKLIFENYFRKREKGLKVLKHLSSESSSYRYSKYGAIFIMNHFFRAVDIKVVSHHTSEEEIMQTFDYSIDFNRVLFVGNNFVNLRFYFWKYTEQFHSFRSLLMHNLKIWRDFTTDIDYIVPVYCHHDEETDIVIQKMTDLSDENDKCLKTATFLMSQTDKCILTMNYKDMSEVQHNYDSSPFKINIEKEETPKGSIITQTLWKDYFDAEGRLVDFNAFKRAIYQFGIEEELFLEAYKYLLEFFSPNMKKSEKDKLLKEYIEKFEKYTLILTKSDSEIPLDKEYIPNPHLEIAHVMFDMIEFFCRNNTVIKDEKIYFDAWSIILSGKVNESSVPLSRLIFEGCKYEDTLFAIIEKLFYDNNLITWFSLRNSPLAKILYEIVPYQVYQKIEGPIPAHTILDNFRNLVILFFPQIYNMFSASFTSLMFIFCSRVFKILFEKYLKDCANRKRLFNIIWAQSITTDYYAFIIFAHFCHTLMKNPDLSKLKDLKVLNLTEESYRNNRSIEYVQPFDSIDHMMNNIHHIVNTLKQIKELPSNISSILT